MADKPDITPELLRQLMRYEPESGKLFWLNRSGSIVPDLRERNSWNARYAGKEVGAVNGKGYLTLEILRSSQKAHRVAWAIYYGEWPNGLIDHINGDRTDNRILNLRVVTIGESAKNRGLQKNNPSGYSGICPRGSNWRVTLGVNGKRINIGTFDNLQEAVLHRKLAEIEYGFHFNHGDRVRHEKPRTA